MTSPTKFPDYEMNTENKPDELELIDILKFFWKWKFQLLAGTIAIAIIVSLITLNQPRLYRVKMTVEPGYFQGYENERKQYICTPKRISNLIESREYKNDLMQSLKAKNKKIAPSDIKFKFYINGSILKVSNDSVSVDLGMEIMNSLLKMLKNDLEEDRQDMIAKIKNEINRKELIFMPQFKDEKFRLNESLLLTEKRLREIESLIKSSSNNVFAKKEQKEMDSQNNANDIRTIIAQILSQKKFELLNQYKNQQLDLKIQIIQLQKMINQNNREIKELETEVGQYQKGLKNINRIIIKHEPFSFLSPDQNSPIFIIIFGTTCGFFFMVIAVMTYDYLKSKMDSTAGNRGQLKE